MILFNTTFYLEPKLIDDWHEWVQTFYVPLVKRTASLDTPQIYRIQSHENGEETVSFAVQFSTSSFDDMTLWENEINELMTLSLNEHFGDRVLCFSTVLKSWP